MQANTADAPVNITVKDEHGRVYHKVFNRPQNLDIKEYLQDAAAVTTSGVNEVFFGDLNKDDANSPEEYYTLTGIRVAKPGNGIYIVRKGSKAVKRIFRNN